MIPKIASTLLSVVLLLLSGCAGPRGPVTYYPDDEQRIDGKETSLAQKGMAVVEFSTNTHEDTTFQQQVGDQLCAPDSSTTAAQLKRRKILADRDTTERTITSVLTLGLSRWTDSIEDDKPQTAIQSFEAGKPLQLVVSSHTVQDNMSIRCGPLYLKFTPEELHVYKVEFQRAGEMCRVSVTDKTDVPLKQVPHSRWSCSTGMFNQGKVLNLRDIN